MIGISDAALQRAEQLIGELPYAFDNERFPTLQKFAAEMAANDFPQPDIIDAAEYANETLCCPTLAIEQVRLAVALATGRASLSSEDAAKILTAPEPQKAPYLNSDAHSVKEPAGALPFKLARDIVPVLDRSSIVDGLLSPGALSLWYGPSNVGKSFVLLNLAAHIALGRDWFTRKTQRGAVLYLAAEGGAEILNRIAAIKKHYAVTEFPLLICDEPINLCSTQAASARAVIETMRQGAEAAGHEVVLVIIDTLNAVFGAGDENSTRDMTTFKNRLLDIKAQTGAHIAVVHHVGKDSNKGARGSSAMFNAVDSAFEFDDGQIIVRKQRDMEKAKPTGFALTSIEIGTKATGEGVTSCVVVPASLRARQDFELKPPKGQAAVALEMLYNITLGGHGATLNEWRDACRGKLTKGSGQRTADVAFSRAMKKLNDHIIFTSGRYLPAVE